MSRLIRRTLLVTLGLLVMCSATWAATIGPWQGYNWDTQPVAGYTGGESYIGSDSLLHTPQGGAYSTSKLWAWPPYGSDFGTYQEWATYASPLVGAPMSGLSTTVYDGWDGTARMGWSVILENASGSILDIGVRPSLSGKGSIYVHEYDAGTSTWSATGIAARAWTGVNNVYYTTDVAVAGGAVNVTLTETVAGVGDTIYNYTSNPAFGNVTKVYVGSAVDGNKSKYAAVYDVYKWTSFSATAVPEPGSLLALGTGLIGLVGFGLRRRRA